MRFRTAVLAACVVILAAVGASAQSNVAVNPTAVQFAASADHSAIGLDGTALVARYELRAYLPATPGTIIATQDLAKPAPATDGTITVTLAQAFIAALPKNVQCLARVVAVGSTGEGASDPSNPFGAQGAPAKAGTPVVRK